MPSVYHFSCTKLYRCGDGAHPGEGEASLSSSGSGPGSASGSTTRLTPLPACCAVLGREAGWSATLAVRLQQTGLRSAFQGLRGI